mmetsp:Transcript_8064/g.9447  ORF Transcript_8064/g.9447 Transcript_8064/m.9447 type:complete len:118 (-) Transcript_8064:80-433(-)
MRTYDSPESKVGGLRKIVSTNLDKVCARARWTILNAYVISERSLIFCPYIAVLKTCGITTLLCCIATFIELVHTVGLDIYRVCYIQFFLRFPGDKTFLHESVHQDLEFSSSPHKKRD